MKHMCYFCKGSNLNPKVINPNPGVTNPNPMAGVCNPRVRVINPQGLGSLSYSCEDDVSVSRHDVRIRVTMTAVFFIPLFLKHRIQNKNDANRAIT